MGTGYTHRPIDERLLVQLQWRAWIKSWTGWYKGQSGNGLFSQCLREERS